MSSWQCGRGAWGAPGGRCAESLVRSRARAGCQASRLSTARQWRDCGRRGTFQQNSVLNQWKNYRSEFFTTCAPAPSFSRRTSHTGRLGARSLHSLHHGTHTLHDEPTPHPAPLGLRRACGLSITRITEPHPRPCALSLPPPRPIQHHPASDRARAAAAIAQHSVPRARASRRRAITHAPPGACAPSARAPPTRIRPLRSPLTSGRRPGRRGSWPRGFHSFRMRGRPG